MLAALIPELAQRIEFRGIPVPDETPIAGNQRQLVRQRAGQAIDQDVMLTDISCRCRGIHGQVG